MGMFDYVKVGGVHCPDCDVPLTGWQTKDSDCTLDTIKDLSQLRRFYTTCPECDEWFEFRLPRARALTDFDLWRGDPYSDEGERLVRAATQDTGDQP